MHHFTDKNMTSTLMLPLAWIYQGLYLIRKSITRPYTSHIPVVCIGNVTVGGTGKTPACRSVLDALPSTYKKPMIVSRGYGGRIHTPTLVNPDTHTAHDVGDEPLLLAKNAPVIVSKNKREGVKYAEKCGADIIVLDDGLQNPTVYKNRVVVVIDGYRGFENGRIIPAGPLRENPKKNLQNAHLILVTGVKNAVYDTLKSTYGDKVVFAEYTPTDVPFSERQSVVPFAGLGNPEKFFETVRACGYPIRAKMAYPDHHMYTPEDLANIRGVAHTALAKMITTEKDFVRLPESERHDITPLYVTFTMHTSDWIHHITRGLSR